MDQTSDQPPGPPSDQRPDVLELLDADHHRVSELLARIGDGKGPVSEVTTHLVAESQLLYPSLRRHLPDADAAVDGLVETDHRIEQLLAEVDRGDADEAVATELADLFAEHVRQQEALFAELHRMAEPEELLRLGEALGPVVMKAPTHPHPHLPREGALEVISDAVASSVDHIRDALKRDDDQ